MIYLDNGATTYIKPKSVTKEMNRCMKKYGVNAGRGSYDLALKAGEKMYECREALAALLHIENPENICFTKNTTEGLNTVIKGYLKEGDHCIISSLEHNSVLRPLFAMKNITYDVAEGNSDGTFHLYSFKKLIQKNTKLIVCNHVSNVTGAIAPIDELIRLAHKKGIKVLIDGAQSAGILPIDLTATRADFFAFPGHKGLFGPMGMGGVYIREPSDIAPLTEGGTGSNSELAEQPDIMPDKFESGTQNLPGIAGLHAGVSFLLKHGIQTIYEKEEMLTKELLYGLLNMSHVTVYGPKTMRSHSGVISFNINGLDCMQVCQTLDQKYHIMVRGGLHCSYLAHKTIGTLKSGTVRASLSFLNQKHDIKKFLDAVNQIKS